MGEKTQIEVKTDGFPFYFDAEELAQALQAWFGGDPQNFVAPARLMIEAQNLLAAAEAALGVLHILAERGDDESYWNGGGEGYAVYNVLRAAIAKAKGEAAFADGDDDPPNPERAVHDNEDSWWEEAQ